MAGKVSKELMTVSVLVTIQAPHYTASLVVVNDTCTEAAPILRWAIGKSWRLKLKPYLTGKGYRVTVQADPSPRAHGQVG